MILDFSNRSICFNNIFDFLINIKIHAKSRPKIKRVIKAV
jgi:hypothetical protein